MSAKIPKADMVARIKALNPCHERNNPGWVAAQLSRMPDPLSARDVVRLSVAVSDLDRLWVAFRLAPRSVVDQVVRRAVMRAVGYAASSLERRGFAAQASTLRALPNDTPYAHIREACRIPYAYYASYAADAAVLDADASYAASYASYAADSSAESAYDTTATDGANATAIDAERAKQLSDFLEVKP